MLLIHYYVTPVNLRKFLIQYLTYKKKYKLLDKLEVRIDFGDMLELISITDDVMGISSDPEYQERTLSQKIILDLGSNIFPLECTNTRP